MCEFWLLLPPLPHGDGYPGKIRFIEPEGEMGPGDVHRVPPAAVCHARARQSSGTGPCVECRRVLLVPGPRGQYSGKIRFIEKPGGSSSS